ncbi:histidine-containing phosphotransfer protein 1-like [Trifolium pratense]|uniref:Histidine-containing phosphotransfer protein n=2 Tax=Trifolium pratense TaxID=57577 RepID=A0A2K3NMR2_TRIPR|nr:histidine-containing phosphotransfer protein 1-like [Trifolium pratense]CAJ2660159.1 unnamed protein product [Trifolium pratense]
MTMEILKGLLQGYLSSLLDEGVVNDRFNEIVCVNNTGERQCVVQRIETYFADVDTILAELSLDVDNSEVDFCKFASLAREIEDKSASIGAEHVRLACSDLIKAGDEMNKRVFFRSVLWVQHEFTSTKKKLDAFIQMERRIIRIERSKSSN